MKRGLVVLYFALQLARTAVGEICAEAETVRLSNSTEADRGRLEICIGGIWSTVCIDTGWLPEVAQVVCQQLGLPHDYFGSTSEFGEGSGPSYYNIGCTGSESSIKDCHRNEYTRCFYGYLTGIICRDERECNDRALKISREPSAAYSGNVYMCLRGMWHSICARDWDIQQVSTFCYDFGYYGASFWFRDHDNILPGVFIRDTISVSCSPTNCHVNFGICSTSGIVGVACYEEECVHGRYHLVGGNHVYNGRLEYCHQGKWYAICADDWEDTGEEARVVCEYMGIRKDYEVPVVVDYYGRGDRPILPLKINCRSSDKNLKDCSTETLNVNECRQIAGVVCRGPCASSGITDCNLCGNCSTSDQYSCSCAESCFSSNDHCCEDVTSTQNCITKECETGAVTLVGGVSNAKGFLKVCVGGVWGGVCKEDGNWDQNNARVVCRQLGFPTEDVNIEVASDFIGDNRMDKVVLGGVDCLGTESELLDCLRDSIGSAYCATPEPVFITCNADNRRVCGEGDVRLVGNYSNISGEVEFCQNRKWKRVCMEGWHLKNTEVVCTQLLLNDQALLVVEKPINYTNPLFVGKFNCSGSEKYLSQCNLDLLPPWRCVSAVVMCDGVLSSYHDNNIIINTNTDATTSVKLKMHHRDKKDDTSIFITIPLALLIVFSNIAVALIFFIVYKKKRSKRGTRQIHKLCNFSQNNFASRNSAEDISSHVTYNDQAEEDETTMSCHINSSPKAIPHPVKNKLRKAPSYRRKELIRNNLLINRLDITLIESIGEGQFGIVYSGIIHTSEDQRVAIKTLKGQFDQAEIDMFFEECLKMGRFKHDNVMNLVGVCLDTGSAPYLIMPYMANGSLLSYLRKERNSIILLHETDDDEVVEVRKKLMIMCLQIAKGMEYLAAEKYVHRDLAARNCMFDDNHRIKITDFGLSEDVYAKCYFRHNSSSGDSTKLPVKWMAPESLNDGHFSEKSDVWSYGVVMWEIFSGGKNPYPASDPRSLMQDLDQGYRMPKPYSSVCSMEIYGIMKDCWKSKPDERPTFKQLVSTSINYTM